MKVKISEALLNKSSQLNEIDFAKLKKRNENKYI